MDKNTTTYEIHHGVDVIDEAIRRSQNGETVLLVHQCNQTSTYVAGLARLIFNRFPECDHGSSLRDKSPQFIHTKRCPNLIVMNLMGQRLPGKHTPKGDRRGDGELDRQYIFKTSLNKIHNQIRKNLIDVVLFPYGIGCGMAGGDWEAYEKMIEKFAIKANNREHKESNNSKKYTIINEIDVVICKLKFDATEISEIRNADKYIQCNACGQVYTTHPTTKRRNCLRCNSPLIIKERK